MREKYSWRRFFLRPARRRGARRHAQGRQPPSRKIAGRRWTGGTRHAGRDASHRSGPHPPIDYAEMPPRSSRSPASFGLPKLASGGAAAGAPADGFAGHRADPAGEPRRFPFHRRGLRDNGISARSSGAVVYFLTPRLGAGIDADYFDRGGTVSERLYPQASAASEATRG